MDEVVRVDGDLGGEVESTYVEDSSTRMVECSIISNRDAKTDESDILLVVLIRN